MEQTIEAKDQYYWILVFNHNSTRTKCEYFVSEDGEYSTKLNAIQLISDTNYRVHPLTKEYLNYFLPDIFYQSIDNNGPSIEDGWWQDFRSDFFEWLSFLQQKCIFDASDKLSRVEISLESLVCRIKQIVCIRDSTNHRLVVYKITYIINDKYQETTLYELQSLANHVYEYKMNTDFALLKQCFFYCKNDDKDETDQSSGS